MSSVTASSRVGMTAADTHGLFAPRILSTSEDPFKKTNVGLYGLCSASGSPVLDVLSSHSGDAVPTSHVLGLVNVTFQEVGVRVLLRQCLVCRGNHMARATPKGRSIAAFRRTKPFRPVHHVAWKSMT